MATRKKAETGRDLYGEVLEEIRGERTERKKAIIKERIKELDAAERVTRKLRDRLEKLLDAPLDEFDD